MLRTIKRPPHLREAGLERQYLRVEVVDLSPELGDLLGLGGEGVGEFLVLLLPYSDLAFEVALMLLLAVTVSTLRLSVLFSPSLFTMSEGDGNTG